MSLLALFTRRKETAMPETTDTAAATTPEADAPLMRFLTVGGATVELRTRKFTTKYTHLGRPYVSDEVRVVDGYSWTCLGCRTVGQPNIFDYDYLPNEERQARDDANKHAAACRAMPRPAGA